jgi:hypothetical protein
MEERVPFTEREFGIWLLGVILSTVIATTSLLMFDGWASNAITITQTTLLLCFMIGFVITIVTAVVLIDMFRFNSSKIDGYQLNE